MELGSEAVKSLLRFFTKGHGQKVGMDVGKWSRENHSGNCPNFFLSQGQAWKLL